MSIENLNNATVIRKEKIMIEKKQLNEEQLGKVSGGDNGDSNKEGAYWADEVKYLYNIGQSVEVYRTIFHGTTKHAIVTERRAKHLGLEATDNVRYVGEYHVRYDDGDDEWVVADDIES